MTPAGCEDIASQLVGGQTGRQFKVILGGGNQHFRQNPNSQPSKAVNLQFTIAGGEVMEETWPRSGWRGGRMASWSPTGMTESRIFLRIFGATLFILIWVTFGKEGRQPWHYLRHQNQPLAKFYLTEGVAFTFLTLFSFKGTSWTMPMLPTLSFSLDFLLMMRWATGGIFLFIWNNRWFSDWTWMRRQTRSQA